MSTLRLAFVCSGNICRSPIAAGFAREKLKARERPAVIMSCGTLGLIGHPAAQFGQMAMEEVGIDISDHYSQAVQPGILAMADYIVVMAPKHEHFFRERFPQLVPKIVRMWEWAEQPLSQIDDPVGQDLAAFRTCRDLLDTCVDKWLDSLS